MNNKKELKSNHSRLMQRLVWLLILTLGIISFGCQCDCEEATDEYYVKYELWVDDGLHRVIVDITVKDENNNDESFTFDAYPQLWETIIGPVQKGFKATINASIKDDILILLQPKIYVSKNDSPFALKANDNSTTGRKSVQLSYTIDWLLFCSKLFHTHLPFEFPPLDNSIKNRFNLGKEEFIKSVLIVKEAFSQFVTENNIHLKLIRSILTDAKFNYLRIKELSDIRIIDMYFWFKENRHKGVTTISQ